MKNKINEVSTSIILRSFEDDSNLAIISTYRTELAEKENRQLLQELKQKVRQLGYGFTELLSRWSEENDSGEVVSSDERALMIYGIPLNDAMRLGSDYQQSSIIYKRANKCAEVCTTDFVDYEGKAHKVNGIVRQFNLKSNLIVDAHQSEGGESVTVTDFNGNKTTQITKAGDWIINDVDNPSEKKIISNNTFADQYVKINKNENDNRYKSKNNSILNIRDAKDIFEKRKGGPSSNPLKSNRPFKLSEVLEVESPKPSTFSTTEKYTKVF